MPTAHQYLRDSAPPPRKIMLPSVSLPLGEHTFLGSTTPSKDSERRLRHVHELPLPTLLGGVLHYVANHVPDVPVTTAHDRQWKPEGMFSGMELVASAQAVVVRALGVLSDALVTPLHTELVRYGSEIRRGYALCGVGAGTTHEQARASASVLVFVAHTDECGEDVLASFSRTRQYRHATWQTPPRGPYTLPERVWAKLYDEMVQRPVRFFVLTNYQHWVFGCFSDLCTTAWVSSPIAFSSRGPNVAEILCYWFVSSRGIAGGFHVPEVAERANAVRRDGIIAEPKTPLERPDSRPQFNAAIPSIGAADYLLAARYVGPQARAAPESSPKSGAASTLRVQMARKSVYAHRAQTAQIARQRSAARVQRICVSGEFPAVRHKAGASLWDELTRAGERDRCQTPEPGQERTSLDERLLDVPPGLGLEVPLFPAEEY